MFRVQSQESQAPAQPRRSIARLHGATAVVAVIAMALVACLVPNSALARSGEPKLLLLPFVVHSAEDPEYVRGGLSDMLSARFARIGGLKLMLEEDAAKGTSRLDAALALARAAGADYVLFGSFTRFGKGASLDVQCAPVATSPAREPLREIFVHSGSIGEIIADLDELAGKVTRFARGENVEDTPKVATAPAPRSREVADLTSRVAALEEALEALNKEKNDE